MENNQHPTPHDKPLEAMAAAYARLRATDENDQNEAIKAKRKALEAEFAKGLKIRDAWKMAEEETAKRYNPAIYNFWRPLGWVDHHESAKESALLTIMHKEGGRIDVRPNEVAYQGAAKNDRAAIEKGVMHAAASGWKKGMEVGGDETFKATAWAYAQIHGVKVTNYKPTGESLALAQSIIQEQQGASVNSPQNSSAPQGTQHKQAPAEPFTASSKANKPVPPRAETSEPKEKEQTYKPDWVFVDDGVQQSAAPHRQKPRTNYPLAVRADKEVITAYNNDRQALLPAKTQPLLLTGPEAKADTTAVTYTDYKPNWVIVRPETSVARASSAITDPRPTDIIISHGGQRAVVPPPVKKQLRLSGPKRVGAGTVIAL